MSFERMGDTQNLFTSMFQDTPLFVARVEGAIPYRDSLGALVLNFEQVETMRASFHHLVENNPHLENLYAPFNQALNDLSYILERVEITRND